MIATSPVRYDFKWKLEIDYMDPNDLDNDLNIKWTAFLDLCFKKADELHMVGFGPAGGNPNMEMLFVSKQDAEEILNKWCEMCHMDEDDCEFSIQPYDVVQQNTAVFWEDKVQTLRHKEKPRIIANKMQDVGDATIYEADGRFTISFDDHGEQAEFRDLPFKSKQEVCERLRVMQSLQDMINR